MMAPQAARIIAYPRLTWADYQQLPDDGNRYEVLEGEVDEQPVWEREIRALEAAALLFPEATPLLLTLESQPPRRPLPNGFDWLAAAGWLLDAEPDAALAPALTPR